MPGRRESRAARCNHRYRRLVHRNYGRVRGGYPMSWSRFDDNWTRKMKALGLSFQARWHYMELIQFVSATGIAEAPVVAPVARTCSDVDDPEACLAELARKGLVTRDRNGDVTLPYINDHIPPPHMRDDKRKADQALRKRRERSHKAGNHDLCPEDRECREPVHRDVTRDLGTGQDRTGLGSEHQEKVTGETDPQSPIPLPRPALVQATCEWCSGQGCRECSPDDYAEPVYGTTDTDMPW